MIVLTLEENAIRANGEVISDVSLFLKSLPSNSEISLILMAHDVQYYACPIRKTVPFLKSAEFSPDHWVGEKLITNISHTKGMSRKQTFIAGILPSPFMKETIHLLSQYSFSLKGVYLWEDLITQAYSPLPTGWAMIFDHHHVLICQDGILQLSRPCYLPFEEEIPAILRYLRRFGYEDERPITLIKDSAPTHALPPFMRLEIRTPQELSSQGLMLEIPELTSHHRLYIWPRAIRKASYALALLQALGIVYLSWHIKVVFEEKITLNHQISLASNKNPVNESKMKAFVVYHQLPRDLPDLLTLVQQLAPLLKEEAVVTHFYWTPHSLILHLELTSRTEMEQLLLIVRSQCLDHRVTWQPLENESHIGTMTIEKNALAR